MTSPDKALAEAAERVRAAINGWSHDDEFWFRGSYALADSDLRALLAHYDASRGVKLSSPPEQESENDT